MVQGEKQNFGLEVLASKLINPKRCVKSERYVIAYLRWNSKVGVNFHRVTQT